MVVFALLTGVSAHAAAPPAPVPKTGQTVCYGTTSTIVVNCVGTGRDGETLAGVAWPDPRFSENGDGTLTDKLTGLAWARDSDPAGDSMTWRQALDHIKALNGRNHLGHADWRLPNINELASLVNNQAELAGWLMSQGFRDVRKDAYWTSSTYAASTRYAWSVGMYSGIVAGHGKLDRGYVWPVRPGGSGVLSLPRSGQTVCYDDSGTNIACVGTGQDGDLQAGAAWPSPRFADNADGTMTDRLTGLMWSQDADAPGPGVCNPGARRTWQGALDHVKCLNGTRYLGKSDWRLPNRNELASLVNHGQSNCAAWLNEQGFSNVRPGGYWSSSTYACTTWNAWGINMHDGAETSYAVKHLINVWPVRGGN